MDNLSGVILPQPDPAQLVDRHVIFHLDEGVLCEYADYDEITTSKTVAGQTTSSSLLYFGFGVKAAVLNRADGMLRVSVPDYLAEVVEFQLIAAVAFRSDPFGGAP